MIDMTEHLITPREIPADVRMESGMVLVRREKATEKRPERRKVIVLVHTRTVRRPVSVFDPDSPMKDVTEWVYVRLKGTRVVGSDVVPVVGPGTFAGGRESVLRKAYRFVGYLADLRGAVDWDAL